MGRGVDWGDIWGLGVWGSKGLSVNLRKRCVVNGKGKKKRVVSWTVAEDSIRAVILTYNMRGDGAYATKKSRKTATTRKI